ncbi:MAG: hypothetical protein IJ007_07120 [Oscillospiraceae bacterium]|nr:hypothetical protein [Oscillospiraceae bacterium]
MKLRNTRYKSKPKKNYILKGLDILLCICTVIMWISREGLGIETSDMLIMTGFTVFVVSMAQLNRHAERKNRRHDEHADKLRDEIGTENYKDASVFFK